MTSAQTCFTVSSSISQGLYFPFPGTFTFQYLLFPVMSRRYPFWLLVVPKNTHCLGWGVTLLPKLARYLSSCLEIKAFTLSSSALRIPASSPISMIQYPCSFSAAVLSFISDRLRLSEYHSPPSFAISVLFPIPWSPFNTIMLSNLVPGWYTRQ